MEFAPINIAGVFRPMRFVNGLKKKGINPIVITFEIDDNLRKALDKIDFSLNDKLDPGIRVIRIPIDDLTQYSNTRWKNFRHIYFNPTDNFLKGWRKNFYSRIDDIIKEYNPQGIIATCPPFSCAVLATDLSKKFNLPLVLDMRDAWAKFSPFPVGSYFHYLYKKKLEARAFQQASAITTVTPQLKHIFEQTHPQINRDKFHLLYNTPNGQLSLGPQVILPKLEESQTLNVGYTGNFYYDPHAREMIFSPWWKRKLHRIFQYSPVKEDWLYRTPYFFFAALQHLFTKRGDWKKKIFFHHIGETP
jgi:hypothetical protein